MNLIPRSSFSEFDSMFDNFFPTMRYAPKNADSLFVPHVDIAEFEDKYAIKADLPGVKKEDIHVTLLDGVLTLEASHSEESEEKKAGKVIRRERRTGSYARSFTVGKGVTERDIIANYTDGTLTLTVPKAAEKADVTKKIDIS